MTADNAISMLICRDAGSAGRMLLARNDLRVRWALTGPEAEAVIKLTKCTVIVARDTLAKSALAAASRSGRKVSSVVLLDPDHWSTWREYFEAGATSVLQVNATDQLFDALSDATGLTFRTAPRVPFRTEVRFALGDEGGAWTSLNLSSSGICIIDFPPYALGSEVDLAFDIDGKTFEFNAIVAQILRAGAQRAVGLAMRDVSPELQAHIDEIIRKAQSRQRPMSEPVEEFDSLDDSTFMQLRVSNVQGSALATIQALTSNGRVTAAETAEPWLVAACDSFSANEVAAVRDPQRAPSWAQDAVLARLRAFRARARAGGEAPHENDVREVLGLCQRLAESASGSPEAMLVQVAEVRADILRALYNPDLLAGSLADF